MTERTETPPRLAAAEVALGRFRVVRRLAGEATCETYLARDENDAEVVLRALWLRGTSSWKTVELLEREAEVLGVLDHPGIPRLVAHGREERSGELVFFSAKVFVPGQTLAQRVAQEPLAQTEAARLGAELARILAYLHSRTPPVVHRDVKPTNVILGVDDTVSLIDFGAVAAPARMGGGSTIVGTYGYIAPEQVVGDAGPPADLYSLGATLLHACTGRDPATFPRQGLEIELGDELSPGPFARLITQLLDPDPRRRPASADEAAKRLDFVAGARVVPEVTEGPREATELWEEVRARWNEPQAHDDFLAWCSGNEGLPFAGQCYRAARDADPDDPVAQRGHQRVIGQALALLSAETHARPDWKRIATVVRAITIIVVVGSLGGLVAWLLLR